MTKVLLSSGVDCSQVNLFGQNAIHLAAEAGDFNMVKILL